MENVTGLIKGKMKATFLEILAELKNCGYQVTAGVLNASYLGVPQARERVIFIGVRDDLSIKPILPSPQGNLITAGQALKGLPSLETSAHTPKDPQWRNVWEKVKPGADFSSVHPKDSYFSCKKLSPDKPSMTIVKTIITATRTPGLYHWDHPRLLNIDELCRIGSFPDTYKWPGDVVTDKKAYVQAWARIGNAVPPLMARAIGLHIRETILKK